MKEYTFLVTGGAGFIGSHLVDALVENGHFVRVFDNFSAGKEANLRKATETGKVEIVKADLKNKDEIKRALDGVDVVFHLAANPDVRVGAKDPNIIFRENILATENILEAITDSDVKFIGFTSSSTVYGEASVIPTPENYAPLDPISIYGASKLANEAMISGFAHTFGFRTIIYRLANVIGPRSTHGVIYDFIQKLRQDPTKLEILGDGTQKKSYIHVKDTVDGMLHLFDVFQRNNKTVDAYNIGNEDWITVSEIAEIVAEVMGLSPRFIYTGGTDGGRGWKGDVKYMLLDITKAKKTGWHPTMGSAEAVRRTAEWMAQGE